MKLAIVGAGWAGMAAAVGAIRAGHAVTVFEAARAVGGRARALPCVLPDGTSAVLDNGQHILIGAYSETLAMMRTVGVDPERALLRLPLNLRFPDGAGVQCPPWPAPLDVFAGVLRARGWTTRDKAALLRTALGWRLAGFSCAADATVAALCAGLTPTVLRELVEPLCVSALNTPARSASAQVFLRVLRDALFGASGSSNLLLPRVDLSALFPAAAARWAALRGAILHLGRRVTELAADGPRWVIQGATFDAVLLATAANDAAHLLEASRHAVAQTDAAAWTRWSTTAAALEHRAITTVYAWGQGVRLAAPMLALRSGAAMAEEAPAQFVFDRGQLDGPPGLLAFVISDSDAEREVLQGRVLFQARRQLGCKLQVVQTVAEKRATFACTPALQRPTLRIAPGLLACADYVEGPYPATLEGAVRAAGAAVQALASGARS